MTLTLGCFTGMEAVDGAPSVALLLLALFLCSAFLCSARNPGTSLALGCLALVYGVASVPAVPGNPDRHPDPGAPGKSARARDQPLVGRWHNLGTGSRGVLRAPRPGPGGSGPRDASAGDQGYRLLLSPRVGRIPEGSWVAVLPGSEVLPWPRGPVPGPALRLGRFDGVSRLHPDEVRILPPRSPGLPGVNPRAPGVAPGPEGLGTLRDKLGRRADAMESSGRAHGLVRALLIGDRSRLSGECLDLFTRTGARHALALSGLHVGLLATLLLLPATACLMLLPLGRSRARRRRLVLGTRLVLVAGYVALVGAGAPVLRAGIAVLLILVAPALPRFPRGSAGPPRRADALSIVSVGWLVELIGNPLTLRDTSLRLSYLATVGIILGTGPLSKILGSLPGRGGPSAAHVFESSNGRRLVRVLRTHFFKYIKTALAASLCAVLATLPEIAERFGELSPLGVLTSPLVLPVLATLVVLSWVGALLSPGLIGELVPLVADTLVGLLSWVDRLPHTPMPLPPRPASLLWLAVLSIFLQLRATQSTRGPWIHRHRRATFLLVGVLCLPWSAAPVGFELHVLDVGHGTAAVVRAPGLPALVFDAGSQQRYRIHSEALGPLLSSWEVDRPWVALSHAHRDHTSGLKRFIERFPPSIWLGTLPSDLGARLADDLVHHDPGTGRTRITTGGGKELEMHLIRGARTEGNEGSRSLELTWRGERILLTGDAEAEGLEHMLRRGWLEGPARLLLFPHHGSHTRVLSALLSSVAPSEVWISSAAPEPPVAAELERRSIPWRGTARQGPLSLHLP